MMKWVEYMKCQHISREVSSNKNCYKFDQKASIISLDNNISQDISCSDENYHYKSSKKYGTSSILNSEDDEIIIENQNQINGNNNNDDAYDYLVFGQKNRNESRVNSNHNFESTFTTFLKKNDNYQ